MTCIIAGGSDRLQQLLSSSTALTILSV